MGHLTLLINEQTLPSIMSNMPACGLKKVSDKQAHMDEGGDLKLHLKDLWRKNKDIPSMCVGSSRTHWTGAWHYRVQESSLVTQESKKCKGNQCNPEKGRCPFYQNFEL
jgi:hypothetical protein